MKPPIKTISTGVAGLIVLVLIWENVTPKWPRSKLPSSATEIHDYDTSGFIAFQIDFFYLLTAKITESEFKTFMDDIGFVKADSSPEVEWWPSMNEFEWWTPDKSSADLYVSTSGWRPNAIAKYENENLYYKNSSGY